MDCAGHRLTPVVTSQTNRMIKIALAALALMYTWANAQESDNEGYDDDEVIEEIIVFGGEKRGDPVDVDALYEDMLRERLMLDQEQLRAMVEEDAWRGSDTTIIETPSRMQWGYDPAEEMRMRRDSDLDNLSFVPTKPATLFRVGF
jgi:hypothetical protein